MTIYYVSNTGDDLANGTSESTPWETITKVNGFAFSPGDSILFNRGDTWSDLNLKPLVNGTAEQRITFSAYGTGDKPLLSTSGSISAILCQKTYITFENFQITGTGTNWQVFINGNYDQSFKNIAINSASHGFRILGAGGKYLLDGVDINNISTGGAIYASPTGACDLELSNCSVDGVSSYIAVYLTSSTFSRLKIQDLTVANAENQSALLFEDINEGSVVDCSDVNITGGSSVGIRAENCGQSSALSIERITVSNKGDNGIVVSSTSGTVNITDSIVNNCNGDGFHIDSGAGGTLNCYSCISSGNGSAGAALGDGFTSHDTDILNLYSCIANDNWDTGLGIGQGTSGEVNVYNSIFYNNGAQKDERNTDIWLNGGQAIKIRNCITSGGEYAFAITNTAITTGMTLDSDYNCFDVGAKFSYNNSDKTFEEFKAETLSDSNSINADPLLLAPEFEDFRISPNSPVVVAGIATVQAGSGPLNRALTVVSGDTYPNVTVKAPLGAMFQIIPEWTGEAEVDLSTFVDTAQSRFGTKGGVIYSTAQDAATIVKIDKIIGNT